MFVQELTPGTRFRCPTLPWLTGEVIRIGEGSAVVRLYRAQDKLEVEFATAGGRHVRLVRKPEAVTVSLHMSVEPLPVEG